jgi:hypothetical protein
MHHVTFQSPESLYDAEPGRRRENPRRFKQNMSAKQGIVGLPEIHWRNTPSDDLCIHQ